MKSEGATLAKAPGPPAHAEASRNGPLLMLLKLEADAREAVSIDELRYLISTESRKLMQARQCFVFGASARDRLRLESISGLPFVDRHAPMTMAIEDVVTSRAPSDLKQKFELDFKSYKGRFEEFAADYPFTFLLWMPFLDRKGQLQGGMLMARERPWTDSQMVVARRLAFTFAHALRELSGVRRPMSRPTLRGALLCAIAAVGLSLRVPVTAMASFEIVPKGADLIAAPMEGIIEEILVVPGANVVPGQALLRFNAQTMRSKRDIAQREVLVAEANMKLAAQLAFTDERGRRDLATAASQVELKSAERDLADHLLSMAEVKAERAGIALFSNAEEIIGRPVVTGEKLMRIANPNEVEASLDVSLADAGLMSQGARVKLFFDAEPLDAREASLVHADYKPKPDASNQLQYRAIAALVDPSEPPRLGARGTALIVGPSASLAYVLLRRPLAALRQRVAL